MLPEAFEPTYWNVVFHPSETRLNRILLGRFQHCAAFTYVPGFRAWIVYDVQWSGMRLCWFAHCDDTLAAFIHWTRDCTLVRFERQHRRMMVASRLGFYCVPAIKCLLGLSCVAVTPDGLYRHLINNGGMLFNERIEPTAAAARSDAATGARAGAR